MTASADRAIKAEVELSAPESKAGRLQRACLALLKQHEREGTIPTNGRFLFYELEQQGVVPKHYVKPSGEKRARTPAQDISDATMRLRELGLSQGGVPWSWILDESRDVTTWRYAASVYELIICEARATRGVLEWIAAEYLCPITATGGQCGGHIVNEIVPLLKDNEVRPHNRMTPPRRRALRWSRSWRGRGNGSPSLRQRVRNGGRRHFRIHARRRSGKP
jgi:hypothetical protein